MKFLLISLFLLNAGYSQAQSFEYKLAGFGEQDTNRRCLINLRQTALTFAKYSGVAVSNYDCRLDSNGIRSGYIVYSAAETVPLHTSLNHGNISEKEGIFTSKRECSQELTRLKKVYRNSTGLTPHAVWCHKTADTGFVKYGISIHAVGFSDVKRFVVGADLDGPLCCSPTAAIQRVYASLKDNHSDLTTIRLNIVSENFIRHFRLEYFSSRRQVLHIEKRIYADTEAECTQLAGKLTKALDKRVLGVFCVNNEKPGQLPFQANILSFAKTEHQSDSYQLWELPVKHELLYDCEAELSNYRGTINPKPLVGTCALSETGKYSIFVAN